VIARLLIANRGEIAVRVARAARELGIAALGVYSEADEHAYHLQFMDDARCIGPAAASESYLNTGAILEAAEAMRADALHPGYGFLSERAAFARAVIENGMIFVGPSPDAMAAVGSKIEAKQRAAAAGVPTIPGYNGADQSPKRLRAEAERVRFPLLIKASAGGGGRGMRRVDSPSEFDDALAAAKREALAAFGDDSVLLERYLENPRHIEFQILGDRSGKIVHLGERECSIQRRHQKVVEEAPSVALTPELRAEMGAAAVRVSSSVGYSNAGTVEFMLDRHGYYFLEMNARLQVEHPITEAVYGVDLVEWQLRIASGERLRLDQARLTPRGWAIEMRVTAEDPAHDMLPSSGHVARWDAPVGPGIRVDSGVETGSDVGLFYDSLLAKLIVSASDRDGAISRAERALREFHVDGVRTNLPLLRWIVENEAFRRGDLGTEFLSQHLDPGTFAPQAPTDDAALLAIAHLALSHSLPWRIGAIGSPIFLTHDAGSIEVWLSQTASAETWRTSGDFEGTLKANRYGDEITFTFNGESRSGRALGDENTITVELGTHAYELRIAKPLDVHSPAASSAAIANGKIAAPMPGRVLRVAVAPGDAVEPHQLLVVLEAMKMEHRIEASLTATVEAVLVREGEIVTGGAPLVELSTNRPS
jgi:3-methylcrotonyl-CoA carboxylase alpha subunit